MATNHHHKLSAAGFLVTLGIVFGDIGTSPLYVMRAVLEHSHSRFEETILGAISCVFWTLTIQTTFKYVLLVLRADNHGEGGIFALFSLVRRRFPLLIFAPMIGGATLLSEGIITPPISVSSAVEGLHLLDPDLPVIPITIFIITMLFAMQRFGTALVGKAFGPIMLVWFSMLALLGISQIVYNPHVFVALNPMYAIKMLLAHPDILAILGTIFLCTTGVEALYSDLGHCGLENIRVSWIFVKISLVLNYFGQGAWLLQHEAAAEVAHGLNPFYAIVPPSLLWLGILIATLAAIVASQALISGSFSLISEAIKLNLFPKLRVVFPTVIRGQLYIPAINLFLWAGCIAVVLIFKESKNMEAAYGLSVTLTMIMTTILATAYLYTRKAPILFVLLFPVIYLTVEGIFLSATLIKFWHGGYITVIMASVLASLMWVWNKSVHLKKKLSDYVKFQPYLEQLKAMSDDHTLPKYATNLVFLTKAKRDDEVEHKIIYSILQKQPKRADIYWFVYIEVTDEPDTMEYKVNVLAPNDVYRVHFRLGFKIQQRVSLFLRAAIEDMVAKGEVNIESRYHSLRERNVTGDFRFVILENVLSTENDLPLFQQIILSIHLGIKQLTGAPDKWFGLDTSLVTVEKAPLVVGRIKPPVLKRIELIEEHPLDRDNT